MKHEEEIALIRHLINETKRNENYRDSIVEFRYIPSKQTGLPYDIYIDDGNSYINHQHDLWLYVVIDGTLHPVTISNNPIDIDNIIDDSAFANIRTFIQTNMLSLQLIADDKMDSSDFVVALGMTKKVVAESLITEMARINMKEDGRSLFPFNGWEIKIWSNDHIPPHFHIIKDGWNVSFVIETGEELKIESTGKDIAIYNYMIANVKEWLNNPCCIMPKLTNQENAMLQWEQIHDN